MRLACLLGLGLWGCFDVEPLDPPSGADFGERDMRVDALTIADDGRAGDARPDAARPRDAGLDAGGPLDARLDADAGSAGGERCERPADCIPPGPCMSADCAAGVCVFEPCAGHCDPVSELCCPTDCTAFDSPCTVGRCLGEGAAPRCTAVDLDDAPCGHAGGCFGGRCYECTTPAECAPQHTIEAMARHCQGLTCENNRCVVTPLDQVACAAGAGQCSAGRCIDPCEGGCFNDQDQACINNICVECLENADCRSTGAALCLEGFCGCAVHSDCDALTTPPQCAFADACAQLGERVQATPVGRCHPFGRCEIVWAEGPCRRETDGHPCPEGICQAGRCAAAASGSRRR
jgi:hypothetical protein